MPRRKPSRGVFEFFSQYIDALTGHAQHEFDQARFAAVRDGTNRLGNAKGALGDYQRAEQVVENEPSSILAPDETPLAPINAGWQAFILEYMADQFGRHGADAIGCLPEAALYAHALGSRFGANELFYRGEEKYGHALISRAERKLGIAGGGPGITDAELDALRRFQEDVEKSPENYPGALDDKCLSDPDHPRWLPVMQHYDEVSGTRLLDISSSIFTGLYFGCVGWHGEIDEEIDGVLYVLLSGNPGMLVGGNYYENKPDTYDADYDIVAPESVQDSFKDWQSPDVFRIYRSGTMSQRELAQDGLFLVRSQLHGGPGFGQSFKMRVPASEKKEIAKELWRAGYTPRRMVRGRQGDISHEALRKELGMRIQ